MRVLLSAAGRAFLRDAAVVFIALATGILTAPNLAQALALAGAASIAALTAGVRAIRIFVPQLATLVSEKLRLPMAYTEVLLVGLTTFGMGFLALVEGVLSAPNLAAGKAAVLAGILALGTALVRVVQAWLTPGESPPSSGLNVPAQPVDPASLPQLATLPQG